MRDVSVPFELIERRARLQRRHRIDEIPHGLGLHQIHPPAQIRAERELAGLGQPRARAIAAATIARSSDRAAVRADLDDVLAGVGMRRGEEGDDRLVDRALAAASRRDERARASRGAARIAARPRQRARAIRARPDR